MSRGSRSGQDGSRVFVGISGERERLLELAQSIQAGSVVPASW